MEPPQVCIDFSGHRKQQTLRLIHPLNDPLVILRLRSSGEVQVDRAKTQSLDSMFAQDNKSIPSLPLAFP